MTQILIVDDSVSVRKALEITFKNHSITSQSAISAEQALEILEGDDSFQLIVIDIIMPGMSGIELCRHLRGQAQYGNTPILLMSGNVDDSIRQEAKEAGATGVLKKPFKQDELIPVVEELLEKAAAGGDEASDSTSPEQEIDPQALNALNEVLQRYEDHPLVRDVVILDEEGHPLKQTSNILPERIHQYAKFFSSTAGVLGKQMLGEEIESVTIRYGSHQMAIHILPSHFVVVLMTAEETTTVSAD